MADYSIRPAISSDGAFLADMVVEAANWRAGATRPKPTVFADPIYRGYIAGWQRPADAGFVAVDGEASRSAQPGTASSRPTRRRTGSWRPGCPN